MKYKTRNRCAIDGVGLLENLFVLKKFPVYMGAENSLSNKDDIYGTMRFDICKRCGSIQLGKLAPLDLVYKDQHNDGIGEVWQSHYQEFAEFVGNYYRGNILEIGGASGTVAKIFTGKNNTPWTIVEPNPIFIGDKKIKVIKGWFDDKFVASERYQTIVHSHVLEHMYDPKNFFENIAKKLKTGDMHIYSFPNMDKQLISKYTNCLNFEHTVLLPEKMVDVMLNRAGFKILEKKYFRDHSIFYATIRNNRLSRSFDTRNYSKYKKLFNEFVNYHLELTRKLNHQIDNHNGEVFLFGGHIFSQYLISFGLKTAKISSILDNSSIKIGKRLYGTNLRIESPESIKNKSNIAVIVKVAGYRDEIIDQLRGINPEIEIWE